MTTPDASELTSGEPLPIPRAGDRTRTGDVQLGKRATPTPISAHQRKSSSYDPCSASVRQPTLDRSSLGWSLPLVRWK